MDNLLLAMFSPQDILLILIVAVLLFGTKRLPEIGEAFGNRDHTTVLHACRTIASLRKQDSVINRDYLVLEQVLKG